MKWSGVRPCPLMCCHPHPASFDITSSELLPCGPEVSILSLECLPRPPSPSACPLKYDYRLGVKCHLDTFCRPKHKKFIRRKKVSFLKTEFAGCDCRHQQPSPALPMCKGLQCHMSHTCLTIILLKVEYC